MEPFPQGTRSIKRNDSKYLDYKACALISLHKYFFQTLYNTFAFVPFAARNLNI